MRVRISMKIQYQLYDIKVLFMDRMTIMLKKQIMEKNEKKQIFILLVIILQHQVNFNDIIINKKRIFNKHYFPII